jgi:hypothetical protein
LAQNNHVLSVIYQVFRLGSSSGKTASGRLLKRSCNESLFADDNKRRRFISKKKMPLWAVASENLNGAGDEIRTRDILLGKEAFYH